MVRWRWRGEDTDWPTAPAGGSLSDADMGRNDPTIFGLVVIILVHRIVVVIAADVVIGKLDVLERQHRNSQFVEFHDGLGTQLLLSLRDIPAVCIVA